MELDMKVALSGFLFGLTFLGGALYINYGIGLAVTTTVSFLTYLVASRKRKDGAQPLLLLNLKDKKASYALFLIPTMVMIMFLFWSSFCFLYTRPFEYFVATAFLSAIMALEIDILKPNGSKVGIYSILVQILLLTAAMRWSSLFAFPSFVGWDPWIHSFAVQYALKEGHVYAELAFPPTFGLGQYTFSPIMHILISEAQLIASLPSLKYAFTFSVGLFEIISILYIFILTRRILRDEKRAAFASLLVGISSWHIMWGFWIIPMTLGLSFLPLILCLLPWHLDKEVGSQKRMITLFLLTFITLVFTHSLSALIVVLFLYFAWIGEKILRTNVYMHNWKRPASTILFIGTIVPAAHWTLSYLIDYMIRSALFSTTFVPMTPIFRSLVHFEIDNIGTYILDFLAILGGLYWLERLDQGKASILAGAAGISVFVYGSVLIGMKVVLPERWGAFLFVLLAPIAADGYHFLSKFLHKGRKVLPLLIFLLSFSMITSSNSNTDSPIYYPEEFVRRSLTESDIIAAQRSASISNRALYVDRHYTVYFRWVLQRETVHLDFSNFDPYIIDGLMIIRKDIYYREMVTLGGALQYTFNGTDKVYSNGEVEMFLRQGG